MSARLWSLRPGPYPSRVERLRVLVVADDPLARYALAALLAGAEDLDAGEGVTAAEAEAALRRQPADVLVWDAGPAAAELDTAYELVELGPPLLVVLADEDAAAHLLGAGASGIIGRDAGAGPLAAAVRALAAGLIAVEGRLAASALPRRLRAAEPVEPLTAREREVTALLAEGLSNRAIAQRLGISEHTAKFHVTAVLGKLGAQTRAEAVAQAVRLGLIVL